MTTIDDALISIFPDFSQFNARLQEGLRAAESRIGDVKIQARVDASEVSRSISEAIRRADKVVTLSTRLDDREFKAKLSTLEHGDAAKITLRANLDAAKARLELALLSNDRTVTIKAEADVAGAKKALEDLARSTGIKAVEEAKTKAASEGAAARKTIADKEEEEDKKRRGRGLGYLGSAGALNLIQGPAIAALIANIAPVTGAVLGLASAFAAAGGASALFGVAVTGHITQITTVMKQMKEQGLQLSELPAPFQKLIPEIKLTQTAWNQFLQDTRGPVFDTFISGLGIAQSMLSKFTPVVNAVAGGVKIALGSIGDFAKGPEVQSFLNVMQTVGPTAIQTLTRSAINLGSGLLTIFTGFTPAGTSMLNMIEGLTQRFQKWATSLKGSPDFQNFLEYSQKYGPKVLDILVNLGVTLVKIVGGLAPVGAVVVTLLQGISKFLSVISPQGWTVIITGLGLIYLNMQRLAIINAVSKSWAVLVALFNGTTLTRIILELRATATAMDVTSVSARGLAGAVGVAVIALYGIGEAADKLSTIGSKAVPGINEMTNDLTGLTSANQIAAKSLKGDWNNIDKDPKAFADALNRITNANTGQRFTDFLHDIHLGSSNLGKDKEMFVGIDSALAGLVSSGHADQAAAAFKKLTAGLSTKEIEQLKTLLPQYTDATVSATGGTNAFGGALQSITPLLDQYNAAMMRTDPQQVADKQLAAFNTLQSSIRGLTEAHYQEGQTAQQTALADVQAARAVKDAQHSYADAQLASKNATVALTKARQDATRALEDQGDKENAALIANQRAKAAAFAIGIKVDGPITPEYQLKQIEIQDALTDTTLNYNRTLEDGNKLRADGRDGAPAVVAAQKAKEDADYNESKSKQAVADAITNQTTTMENGAHARAQAAQATVDATVAEQNAQVAYDASTKALSSTGDAAKITTGNLSGLRGELSNALIMDASNPLKQLQDIATYMEAIKILAADPNMAFTAAWTEAQGHVTGTNVLPTVNGVTGPWAPGYTGQSNSGSLGAIGQRAMGGVLRGPGTGTSDSIPILASTGEYVLRAAAVDRLGVAYLDHLNQADKFATGGYVNTNTLSGIAKASGSSSPSSGIQLGDGKFTAVGNGWPKAVMNTLSPNTGAAQAFIKSHWPGQSSNPDYNRKGDPGSDHPRGKALDNSAESGTASGLSRGNDIANWFTQNPNAFGTKYVIWNKHIADGRKANSGWSGPRAFGTVGDREHIHHVHVSFVDGDGTKPVASYGGTLGGGGTSTGGPASGASSTSISSTMAAMTRATFDSYINPLLAELKGSYIQQFAKYAFDTLYRALPQQTTTTTSTSSSAAAGASAATGAGGIQGASQFGGPHDPGTGTHGYKGDSLIGKMAYAELSKNPAAKDFAALGGLPYKQKAHISYKGKTIDAEKLDIGGGGGDVSGHHRSVDLWYELANALGFPGTGLINFQTFAKGGPIRDNGKVVADRGAILPPMSRTIVENRTSQNENVGFGTRLDEYSLQRLAQILSAMKFQNYLDGKEMRDHINENFGHHTGTAGL